MAVRSVVGLGLFSTSSQRPTAMFQSLSHTYGCNPGIPVNFANPEIPGLSTRNLGILGIEKFPISVHYYVTKWHFMFCCKSATAIAQDCMSLPLTYFSPFTCFLTRDAMRKRGLCCRPVSVSPSVCHVRVLYPDGWRYHQTSFSAR